MKAVTFSELRNHAKKYFDQVESGESLEVYRKGKPVALLVPAKPHARGRYWQDSAAPLKIDGASLSQAILAERAEEYRP